MVVTTIIEFIAVMLTLAYLVMVGSFIRGWLKLKNPVQAVGEPVTAVTVIIAARNEENAIGRCLKAIFDQDYPACLLEVIVVDDHSTDKTADVIRFFDRANLTLIRLNEKQPLNSYKKKAIATAIAQAKGELIVTTDADCWMGNQWLRSIVSEYERHNYEMISSPVAYAEEKSVFERLQGLEFMYLIGLGASAIGNAFASTCNGANLAYTKKIFYQVDGFKGIDDLASGDDELLMHKVSALYYNKIGFVKSADAIVYTHAKPTLKEFIHQRKRWASKSVKYRNKLIVALGLTVYFFNLFLLFTGIGAIVEQSLLFVFLGIYAAKVLVEAIYLSLLTTFFGKRKLLLFIPLVSILHAVYIVYIGIAGQQKAYEWKGRQVK